MDILIKEIPTSGIKLATHRLIDSVWTLTFTIVDEKMYIFTYDDMHKEGYQKENQLPNCKIITDDNRNIIAVVLDDFQQFRQDFSKGKRYDVLNPQYIFSYNLETSHA